MKILEKEFFIYKIKKKLSLPSSKKGITKTTILAQFIIFIFIIFENGIKKKINILFMNR